MQINYIQDDIFKNIWNGDISAAFIPNVSLTEPNMAASLFFDLHLLHNLTRKSYILHVRGKLIVLDVYCLRI